MRMALVLVALLAWAGPARAADDDKTAAARRFYETGTLLYDRGEFLDAAREFERAYREQPKAALLYNIATAYDKAGERDKAVENYRKYVASMPNSSEVAVSKARADVLEREAKELAAARAPKQAVAPARNIPPPLPFVEPVTKYTYQTWMKVDGVPYTLIGAGARKVYGFKVYAMGLYLEDEPARKGFPQLAARAGGSDHDSLARGDLAHQFVVLGDFGKLALLHFVRNVSGKDTRDAYREALGDDVGKNASPDLKRDAEAFLAMFDDIKDGEDLTIRTTGAGQVIVEARGQKKLGPTNARLAHDIWDIWLGQKPISADLKKGMLDRIDTLGR
ncbi:MAG: chalcone isomerase family protein [Polyangia bacterium]